MTKTKLRKYIIRAYYILKHNVISVGYKNISTVFEISHEKYFEKRCLMPMRFDTYPIIIVIRTLLVVVKMFIFDR